MEVEFEIKVQINRSETDPDELQDGLLVDLLKRIKAQISAANSAVKQADADRKAVEALLAERMAKGKVPAIYGASGGTARMDEKDVARIVDFEEFGEFCSDENAWHLFQRRINNSAYNEMLEERGEAIPGLETFTVKSVITR